MSAVEEVKPIRLQHLHPSKFHHRSVADHMAGLTASIAEFGIIEPLIVRKRKEGGYEIAAGVCRRNAAEAADLKTAPCIIRDIDDETMIALQVDENEKRRGLHPIDVALYCQDLHELGMNHEQIGKRLNMKRKDIAAKLRLVTLTPAARKAFVAGRFDEESALALTTTSDPAKQSDVLAALDAGTLQPEEIAGYIRRTFTASLDDVPWRTSDEKLVPKAGPCTTCPKRSDVQRDMFPKDQTGTRCLDVDCWRGKMEASFKLEAARPGVVHFDQSGDELFMLGQVDERPKVLRSSGMVDADATCPLVPSRTWREAVFSQIPEGGEAPSCYLTRDQDGRPRFVMREASVVRIVKKSPDAKQAAEAKRATDAVKPDGDPPVQSPRVERRIRTQTLTVFAERVISGDHETWAWIVSRLLEGATARSVAMTAELLAPSIAQLEQTGLQGKEALIALAETANRQAKRVATAIMIFEEADVIGEIPPAIRALSARCDLDLSAIEAEIRGKP